MLARAAVAANQRGDAETAPRPKSRIDLGIGHSPETAVAAGCAVASGSAREETVVAAESQARNVPKPFFAVGSSTNIHLTRSRAALTRSN